jgi:hypothetical protein
MTELRVSPNGVSHSAEKRFENTGSSRSSSTDLEGESEEVERQDNSKIGRGRESERERGSERCDMRGSRESVT